MWPPSCHAASQWSTLTPRTSPSLTRETGWSDDVMELGVKKNSFDGRGQMCSGAPPPLPFPKKLCTPPSAIKESSLFWREAKHRRGPLFLCGFFFYLVISLSCCSLCLEENLHVVLVCLSCFQEKFLHSFFSARPHHLFSWISCDEILHVYYCYTW